MKNVNALLALLLSVCSFGCASQYPHRALGDAVAEGNLPLAKSLAPMDCRAVQDRYGRSVLLVGIEIGNDEIIEFLLDRGADPYLNLNGKIPLEYAIMKGKVVALKHFVGRELCFSREEAQEIMNVLAVKDGGNPKDFLFLESRGANKNLALSKALMALEKDSPVTSIGSLLHIGARPDKKKIGTIFLQKANVALMSVLRRYNLLSRADVANFFDALLKDIPLHSFDRLTIMNSIASAEEEKALAEIGFQYYHRANFRVAALLLELAADLGNSEVQNFLGYRNGEKPNTERISFKKRLAIKKAYECDD